MKVVITDNYGRENIPDSLLVENVSADEARRRADDFNNDPKRPDCDWTSVKGDDYVLWNPYAMLY